MMLDPLRVKNHLEPVRIFFRPRFLFFDFGWLKHLDRLLNYQFRFSNFPNLPILNQMKLFSLEFGSKQRSTLFEKTFMVSTPGTYAPSFKFSNSFHFSFFFYHTEERWLDRSLSESVVICHGLVLTVTPYVFERLSKWTVHGWTVRGWMSRNINFDRFLSIIWWFHLWIMVSSFLTGL